MVDAADAEKSTWENSNCPSGAKKCNDPLASPATSTSPLGLQATQLGAAGSVTAVCELSMVSSAQIRVLPRNWTPKNDDLTLKKCVGYYA